MATKTLTKDELKGLIDEMIADKVGSTLDERLKAHRSTEAAAVEKLLASLNDPKVKSEKEAKQERVDIAAKCVMAIAGAALSAKSGNYITPQKFAEQKFGKDDPTTKALGVSTGEDGGFTISEEYSAEIIEFLRPASAVRKLNPVILPMDAGNLTLPKIAGGAAAGYIGENQNAGKTQQTFGQVKAVAKKLAALVPISNDLVRRPNRNAVGVVRDDLIAALAQRSDLAFIRDAGSQYAPRGLRYWAPAANVIGANATVNLANVTVDLGKLVLQLVANNVRMLRPGWLLAPRTWNYLMTVRDANGNFAFRDEMLTGTLWGYPFAVTSQIPVNLGGGTNESEVTLADFADVIIGESTQVLIDSSPDAAYWDGTQVVAAYSQDQTVLRAIVEHDLVMRHAESVAVLNAVLWT